MLKPILEHLCSSLTILAYCLSVVHCTRFFSRFLSRIVGSLLSSLFNFQGPFRRPVSRAPDYNTTSAPPCQHFFAVFFNIFFGCCRTAANSTTYCIFALSGRLSGAKNFSSKHRVKVFYAISLKNFYRVLIYFFAAYHHRNRRRTAHRRSAEYPARRVFRF